MDIRNPSPNLYNEDLAPAKDRHWGAFSIFNVWTSDVHSLWGYYLAASLFLLCGSFVNFIVAIGIGSLIIFVLMSMMGTQARRPAFRTRCWLARPSAYGERTFLPWCVPSSLVSGTERRRRRHRARLSPSSRAQTP